MTFTKRPDRRFARRAVLAAAAVLAACVSTPALAQVVEITYATFLDPNNKNDPRAAAQTKLIEAFEKANPNIKVKVQVDPNQQASLRALRSKSATPDVTRFTNFSMLEAAKTGSLLKLDPLIARDSVSTSDWLLPLEAGRVMGGYYGMQQDFRIPILIYRKSLVEQAGAKPPRTFDELCVEAAKVNKGNIVGYALPLGTSGGLGGAQPLAENHFSSMISEASGGKYFAEDGREFTGGKDAFIKVARTIKDLYGRCNAVPRVSVQFGYNEIHDGLRAGTVGMATFGLFRFRAIQTGGAGDDLAWAPPPAFSPDGKLAVYGFQAVVNANSPNTEAAWQFVKYLTSPEGQAILAEGGEVVGRASVYSDPKLSGGVTDRQRAWADLVRARGRFVDYSIISTTMHQILGDAMQRMILADGTPEQAWEEFSTRYREALARTQ